MITHIYIYIHIILHFIYYMYVYIYIYIFFINILCIIFFILYFININVYIILIYTYYLSILRNYMYSPATSLHPRPRVFGAALPKGRLSAPARRHHSPEPRGGCSATRDAFERFGDRFGRHRWAAWRMGCLATMWGPQDSYPLVI